MGWCVLSLRRHLKGVPRPDLSKHPNYRLSLGRCVQLMRNKISHVPDRLSRRPQIRGPAFLLIGRPSLCRQIFIHANRTRRSDLTILSASLYRACNVPGSVIAWLTKIVPVVFGASVDLVEFISNRSQRFSLRTFSSARASTLPPTAEMIPPRAANSSQARLTLRVFPVPMRAQIR